MAPDRSAPVGLLHFFPRPVDSTGMLSGRTNQPIAIAGFRGRVFQGYGVRTMDGWVCVVAMGMTWGRTKCMTLSDCRLAIKAATHAGRFEHYTNLDDLMTILNKLQPHEQPYILPEQIPDVLVPMQKLGTSWY